MPKKSADNSFFYLESQKVFFKRGQSILEAINRARISIYQSCGGMGTCGTCRVVVRKGLENFEKPNDVESELAQEKKFGPNERLSCQNLAISMVELEKAIKPEVEG